MTGAPAVGLLRAQHGARADEELRRLPVLAQATALFAGLAAIPLLPGGSAIAGLPWSVTRIWGGVLMLGMWTAFAVHRFAGGGSRAYLISELFESFLFAHGSTALVGLSGQKTSIWWLIYFALCLYDASAMGARPGSGLVILTAPITAAVIAYTRTHLVTDAVSTMLIGALGGVAWGIIGKKVDRSLVDTAVRGELQERVAELERERGRLSAQAERRQIAMDLHDGIGATLTAARLMAQAVRGDGENEEKRAGFEVLDQTLGDGLADLRLAVWSLDHERLDWAELFARVRRQCADLAAAASLRFEMSVDVGDAGEPSPLLRMTVLRVVQEAVVNVVRHAHATALDVRVSRCAAGLSIFVEDDGRGPDEHHGDGRGISNMTGRIRDAGGTFVLEARSEGGTRVHVVLPM